MDYGFFNWMAKVKQYYPFSTKELLWIGVSILVVTFIVAFDDGGDTFDTTRFINNALLSLVAVTIAIIIHESAHRIAAPNLGYYIEFKPFLFGLLGGVILAFMTYGKFLFLAYGSYQLKINEKHRLGYFRHHLGYFDNGKIAVVGPLANLFAAIVFKILPLPLALQEQLVFINALFAIYYILPIPYLDGANVMYATRHIYPFTMGAIIAAAGLLLVPGLATWIAVASALGIGLVYSWFYFSTFEKIFGSW